MLAKHQLKYLKELALSQAAKSPDTTKVGAVLVDGAFALKTAYNGLAPNVHHLPERLERPEKYKWCVHAEQALIAKSARDGIATDKKSVITTHIPCCSCADTLIFAGIQNVYYLHEVFGEGSEIVATIKASRAKFSEAGIGLFCIGE